MNFPHSWLRMSALQKRYYLLDSHQAQSFSDAGRKLSQMRRPKLAPKSNLKPKVTNLPYKDDSHD